MSSTLNAEPAATLPGVHAPNFDRLARLYRWMEIFTFGPFLARCRVAFLPDLISARHALVLGDGDGRFTARLLLANPRIHVDAIDLSPAMLRALLRRAGPHSDRVSAHCIDARFWLPPSPPPNPRYDLVVTHFFLDCLTAEEAHNLASRLRSAISLSAVWVVSEFAVPDGWFGRFVARPVIWLLYRAFGLLTGLRVRGLPDHHAALRDAGFTLYQRRARLFGMLVSELWCWPSGATATQSR